MINPCFCIPDTSHFRFSTHVYPYRRWRYLIDLLLMGNFPAQDANSVFCALFTSTDISNKNIAGSSSFSATNAKRDFKTGRTITIIRDSIKEPRTSVDIVTRSLSAKWGCSTTCPSTQATTNSGAQSVAEDLIRERFFWTIRVLNSSECQDRQITGDCFRD